MSASLVGSEMCIRDRDCPGLTPQMEATADKLAEAGLFRPDSQSLCILSLVRHDNPHHSDDVICFIIATGKTTSVRARYLAKFVRLALGSLSDDVPVREALRYFPKL
eukprot:8838716-Alexandrium_andersonii.AAC.1